MRSISLCRSARAFAAGVALAWRLCASAAGPTVAVLSFDTRGTKVLVNPGHVLVVGDVDVTTRRLSDDLIVSLTRSGRFTVVERDRVAALENEASLIDTAAGDAVLRLGSRLGAEYLLTGRIVQMRAAGEKRTRAYTETLESVFTGKMDVSFRLLATRGGAVAVADTVSVTHTRRAGTDSDYRGADFVAELQARTVEEIVTRIVHGVFPESRPAGGEPATPPDTRRGAAPTPGSSEQPIRW